jgi:hypothetical protein
VSHSISAQLPVTTSELDARPSKHGFRRPADHLDLVAGLRAQVTGQLPDAKPALPVVITTRLPRQTREASIKQERAIYERKLAARKHGIVAGTARDELLDQLVDAEQSCAADHARTWALQQQLEGRWELLCDDLTHGAEVADPAPLATAAAEELREMLVLHLTEREVQALQLRADGVAQVDRSGQTLARAQRKARAAMAG